MTLFPIIRCVILYSEIETFVTRGVAVAAVTSKERLGMQSGKASDIIWHPQGFVMMRP